jgi:hypothetical protein
MSMNLVTIMCCHEAAHAVAAYRREIPYHYVRFTIPRGLDIKDTDLGIDVRAMDVAHRYLQGTGQDTVRYWAGYLSVLAIAKHANIHLNHVPEDVAAGFARSDYDVFNARLAEFTLAVQQQVMAQVNELVNDVAMVADSSVITVGFPAEVTTYNRSRIPAKRA